MAVAYVCHTAYRTKEFVFGGRPPGGRHSAIRSIRRGIIVRRQLLNTVFGIALVSLSCAVHAGGDTVVYHINENGSASALLTNVRNHLVAAPDTRIHVVSHGRGIDFLLKDARDASGEPYAGKIKPLAAQGVQFKVCRNTLNGRNLGDDAVDANATIVPAGVAEIARLQTEEKAAYLKP